jgi:hypothetical protein
MPRDQPRLGVPGELALDQQGAVLQANAPHLGVRGDRLDRDREPAVLRRVRPHAEHARRPGDDSDGAAAALERCQARFRVADAPGARAGRGQVGQRDLALALGALPQRHAQRLGARPAQLELGPETRARDQEPAPLDDLGAHRQQLLSPQAVQAIVMSV